MGKAPVRIRKVLLLLTAGAKQVETCETNTGSASETLKIKSTLTVSIL